MTPSVLVIGCGSIGLRHLRNLKALGVEALLAFDPSDDAREAARAIGARPFERLDAAFDARPGLVLVCTPPHVHVRDARRAVAAGADVFIEKPVDVAATPDLDALIGEAASAGRIAAAGYNLRCHPGLRAIKQAFDAGAIGAPLLIDVEFGFYLPDWRPGRDYRENYGARKEQGGGILLDASHEVDYLRWLAGEAVAVQAVLDRIGTLEMDVEDTACLTVRLASGALAQLRVDCLQRRYTRRCKIAGERGSLEWTWEGGATQWIAGDAAPSPLAGVPDVNDMYVEEMRGLLEAVRERRDPVSTVADARKTLQLIDAARRASAERREVAI